MNELEKIAPQKKFIFDLDDLIKLLLRKTWRKMGREYNQKKIALFPMETHVKLVPGAIRLYIPDGTPILVRNSPEEVGKTWRVVCYSGPDVSNMPTYTIQRGSALLMARHKSLKHEIKKKNG